MVPEGGAPILGAGLKVGDEIVLVESAGLHANGASLARMLAGRLERGYETPLPSGRPFGEALLDRSVMYVPLVGALLDAGVDVHYLSHITGHGLLKLMRPRRELSYTITSLPDVPEVLDFMVEKAGMSPAAAYSTFNMGCGFAVYSAAGSGQEVVRAATELGLSAHAAGTVGEGPRRVVLEPVAIKYESEALDLAPRHLGPAE
jgi:phosphoribosylformylglycinamidine cyclo-ligase